MEFKHDLPSDCPDKNKTTIGEDRIFFRIVKNFPPTDEDFIPLWFSNKFSKAKECLARGVSITEKLEDIKAVIKAFPNTFGSDSKIVQGKVKYEEHGIVKLTPNTNPSHRTWYPLDITDEKDIFCTEV